MKILLGPAGSPEKTTIDGLKTLHDLDLQAMEVAFTRGVKMGNETARQIRKENEKYNISLSIHAPYYINLNSLEKQKVKDSKKRILDTCERAHHMGAKRIVIHAGYYHENRKKAYDNIRREIEELLEEVKRNQWDVEVLPETAGRASQFGDLDEIIQMNKDTKCGICVDPAHIFARNQGKINFEEIFDKLGKIKQKEYHFHFSGIAFGPSGERNHLTLGEGGPDFKSFAEELINRKKDVTVISESPITWKDSLVMKKILEKMKK